MTNNLNSTLSELRHERDKLNQAIAALEDVSSNGTGTERLVRKRTLSAGGRARIAAAQRKRWAKVRGRKVVPIATAKRAGKRTMSPTARKRIAAAQRARWAKVRKEKAA